MKHIWIEILLIMILLSGCSTAENEVNLYTDEPYRVYLTPSLHPMWPAFQACAAANPQAVYIFKERFYDQIGSADLIIRLGEPEELPAFAAILAEEEIVVVLNGENSVTTLSKRQIQNIFHGAIDSWEEVGGQGEIRVWALLEADEASQLFNKHILYPLRLTPYTRLAPDAEFLLQALQKDPNAIGYLPHAWVDENINTIDVGIKVPVLVLADEEPQGDLRQLVLCLQGEVGQKALSNFYLPIVE